MSNKKITDLNAYTSSQVKSYDLFFVTDIDNQETKKIDAANLANFVSNLSASSTRTGSFTGSFNGITTNALNLLYSGQPNGTASYAIYASNSFASVSSSYALTASYALNGGSGGSNTGVNGTFTQPTHGFSIGDVVYNDGNNSTAWFYVASSVYGVDANEVVGIISATSSADTFTVSYGGLVDFGSNPPSIFSAIPQNGNALFLSGSNGKLSLTDPSSNSSHISKPVLIKMTDTQAFIINQRGLHASVGGSGVNSDSASYLIYNNAPNGTASYAITASYALNGGSGGSGTAVYYLDDAPIGSIIAHASQTAPTGYLPCDGRFLRQDQYSELFNKIGRTVYDADFAFGNRYKSNIDGTFTANTSGEYFKIPDLRGIFVRGFNDGTINNGKVSSPYDTSSIRKFGSQQLDAAQGHIHNFNINSVYSTYDNPVNSQVHYLNGDGRTSMPTTNKTDEGAWNAAAAINDQKYITSPISDSTNGTPRISNEDRPVNLVLNYYIKALRSTTTSAELAAIQSGQYALNGDVKGTVGASVVTALQGKSISNVIPQPGDLLRFDGTQWTPTSTNTIYPYINSISLYCSNDDDINFDVTNGTGAQNNQGGNTISLPYSGGDGNVSTARQYSIVYSATECMYIGYIGSTPCGYATGPTQNMLIWLDNRGGDSSAWYFKANTTFVVQFAIGANAFITHTYVPTTTSYAGARFRINAHRALQGKFTTINTAGMQNQSLPIINSPFTSFTIS